jgi:hypothetical protein
LFEKKKLTGVRWGFDLGKEQIALQKGNFSAIFYNEVDVEQGNRLFSH